MGSTKGMQLNQGFIYLHRSRVSAVQWLPYLTFEDYLLYIRVLFPERISVRANRNANFYRRFSSSLLGALLSSQLQIGRSSFLTSDAIFFLARRSMDERQNPEMLS